ncbi:hypothetical protein [Streptomyces sp. NPDC017529]|uniref:hypothetical protein n=1 Tax=Streptomyces sp. NPDC017529 TaxID=3365000 RepID=UPI0037AB250B
MGAQNGDSILITGAREHNLEDVTLEIPKGRITVFTGVSGSGKSSLVFDTVAVESQRQLNETFPSYVRNRLPKHERPKADTIERLAPAVVVDQRPVGGGARSTVGTMTDIHPILRVLFSRRGTPSAGEATAYSFNDPVGMCPQCAGLGRTTRIDLDRFLDTGRSLNEGAIRFPPLAVGTAGWQIYATSGLFDPDKPLDRYGPEEWDLLLYGKGFKVTRGERAYDNTYEGLVENFDRRYVQRDPSALSEKTAELVRGFVREGTCPQCQGARLTAAAIAARAVTALDRVAGIGLGYLSLDRPTPTLSGGEGQRLKMVRHLGSSLTGLTYVFDEPSTGLHPGDVRRLNDLLVRLRDKGNTVLALFAREHGVPAGLFSFNAAGACEECRGRGVIHTDLAYLDPVTTTCEACRGRRFKDEVLGLTVRGRSVADVLEMTAADAVAFFGEAAPAAAGTGAGAGIGRRLAALAEAGLGYLTLGQSVASLSGGERQCLKLATRLHRTGSVYVFDEPTAGLHMADVAGLPALLDRLVADGNTVLVVEHDLDVVKRADWVVDLGPGGGRRGGEIVFAGPPRDLLSARGSATADCLRASLDGAL